MNKISLSKCINAKELPMSKNGVLTLPKDKAIVFDDFIGFSGNDDLNLDIIVLSPNIGVKGYAKVGENDYKLITHIPTRKMNIQFIDTFHQSHYYIQYSDDTGKDLNNCLARQTMYIITNDKDEKNNEKEWKDDVKVGDVIYRRDKALYEYFEEESAEGQKGRYSVTTAISTTWASLKTKESADLEGYLKSLPGAFGNNVLEVNEGMVLVEHGGTCELIRFEDAHTIKDIKHSADFFYDHSMKRKNN